MRSSIPPSTGCFRPPAGPSGASETGRPSCCSRGASWNRDTRDASLRISHPLGAKGLPPRPRDSSSRPVDPSPPPLGGRRWKVFVAGPHRAGVLIKRGAEAELRRTEFLGRPAVDKVRVPNSYRLTELDDALRRPGIRHDARLMSEARAAGVPVPTIYDIDLGGAKIVMEYVPGPTLKDVLDRGGPVGLEVAREMGRVIGRLHRAGIVHVDLTTSNMLWRDGRIVMIDFSLGGKERGREARGVDLQLLRGGLVSAAARATAYYREVVRGYREVRGAAAEAIITTAKESATRG